MCRNVVQRRLSAYDEKFDDIMVKSKERCDEIFLLHLSSNSNECILTLQDSLFENYFGYKRSRED